MSFEKSIKWDEETIAEHDKERGTRQKIDEPPTPYVYGYDGEEEDGARAAGTEQTNANIMHNHSQQDIAQNWSALDASLQYELQCQNQCSNPDLRIGTNLNADIASERDSQTFPEGIFSPHLIRRYPGVANAPDVSIGATEQNGYEFGGLPAAGNPPAPSALNDFKQKRDMHYNEYKVMKAMLSRKMEEEDEENC